MQRRMRLALAAGVFAAGLSLTSGGTVLRASSPLDVLAGYWSGIGHVNLKGGKTERVKCAVTYKVGENGTHVRQNMRCASADYTINASADLRVQGAQVTGSWEEKTYSATGQVFGKFTDNVFALSIKGGNFTAAMKVDTNDCKQNINITPQGLEVNRITIGLTKC